MCSPGQLAHPAAGNGRAHACAAPDPAHVSEDSQDQCTAVAVHSNKTREACFLKDGLHSLAVTPKRSRGNAERE